jgi:hypothetical protein
MDREGGPRRGRRGASHPRVRAMPPLLLVLLLLLPPPVLVGGSTRPRRGVEAASAFRPPAIPLLTTDPQNQNWLYSSEPTADVVRTVDGRQRQMMGLLRIDGAAPHRWLGDCSLAPTEALGATRTERNVDLACDLLTYETLSGVGQAGHDTCNRLCYADSRCLAYTTTDSRAKPGHVYCTLKNCTDQLIPLKRHNPVVHILTGPRQPPVSWCPPAARTLAVHVGPTSTRFVMAVADVQLNVSFATTMFTDDHVRLSRPAFYVNYDVASLSGQSHDVDLYLDVSAQATVAEPRSNVSWRAWPATVGGLRGVRMGASPQRVLGGQMVSDNMISWGFLHAAVPADDPDASVQAGSIATSRQTFLQSGHLPRKKDARQPRATFSDLPGLCTVFRNITTGRAAVSKRTVMLGYDDVQAISYFGNHLPGMWTRAYSSIEKAMAAAYSERQAMSAKAAAFEAQLMSELRAAGGESYAQLGILSYRQGLAATKLVWNAECNCTWSFLKEINSCGDMNTVDVIFPTSPLLLYSEPALLRMLLLPILHYANNGTYIKYTDPFSPHQLGVYPIGNSTTAEQELMPLENTGNMFLMLLGIVQQVRPSTFL